MEDMVNYFSLLTKFQFATEGYVLLAYLEMCAVKTLKEVPESFPVNGNPAQQMAWVNRLSRRILRYCWLGPLPEDVEAAAKAYDNPTRVTNADTLGYCICGEGELMPNPYHNSLLLSCWNAATMLSDTKRFSLKKIIFQMSSAKWQQFSFAPQSPPQSLHRKGI